LYRNVTLALVLAAAANAAPCTYLATDTFLAKYLTPALQPERNLYHNWMLTTLGAAPAWSNTPIKNLLIGGSHDAGTFGESQSKLPDKWAVTQTHSILDQLCLGSRWFDVRLRQGTGTEWRIFHNNYLFETGDDSLEQFKRFIQDPAHAEEIVFVRMKLEGKDKAALLQHWVQVLGPNAVDKKKLPKAKQVLGGFGPLTPAEIHAAAPGAGGRIVLLEYPKDESAAPDIAKDWLFNYNDDQTGTFSNKVEYEKMVAAQTTALTAAKRNAAGEPFALWWTSTGKVGNLNVRKNTAKLWQAEDGDDTALEEFYVAQGCSIGTFLIVDYFGDHELQGQQQDTVMKIVMDHNARSLTNRTPTPCVP
jgi:hypothetical protein